jgi:drug/metabolite transporter (DMT)-like permease
MLGVGNGAVVWTEQHISSGMAALLVSTFPFWVAGFESLTSDGERITPRIFLGMLLGFLGLALLVAPNLFGTNPDKFFVISVILLQVACISWTAGSVYAKHNPVKVPSLMGAAVQMLVAGFVLATLGALKGELPALHFNVKTFAALSYLILFGSIVAFGSYNYAIQKLPLSFVSMYSYINPIIAVLLGWVLLAEPFGWRIALATTIILSGVALVKGKSKKKEEETPTDEVDLSIAPEPCVVKTS